MRNNTKKTILIISFLIIFIVGIFAGYKLIETANQSKGFKTQSSEVSSQNQQKIEAVAGSDNSTNQALINTVPDKAEIKNSSGSVSNTQTDKTQTKPSENLNPPENQNTFVKKEKTCSILIQTPNKVVLHAQTVEIVEGDTVFDILKKVTRENKIQMEFSGTASNIYIKGIDNLYEFDNGPKSGWLYTVDKQIPQKSCGGYKLVGGEVIKWHYTLNMGEDIKE